MQPIFIVTLLRVVIVYLNISSLDLYSGDICKSV